VVLHRSFAVDAMGQEEIMELKTCPFCGITPIITECAPKINGEYQWQIACEEDFCLLNPEAHGFGSKEQATKAWNHSANAWVALGRDRKK
jgi:hypothetical protein